MVYILIHLLRVHCVLRSMLNSTVTESKTSHLSDVRSVTKEIVKIHTDLSYVLTRCYTGYSNNDRINYIVT
ncbi:MAG: hypothetical protein ACJAR6_000665 [Oleispira sp.]|jgi:hypothetical protein